MSSPSLDVAPVTRVRILNALDKLGFSSLVDDEGDVAVSFFPHLLFIVTEKGTPILGIAGAPRVVDVQHAEIANRAVANHNSHFFIPKLYTTVSDQGKIRFRLSHCFNWDIGATDEQIITELNAFVHGTMEAIARLEEIFPDPWAEGESHND